ncbi:MAG: NAD(P)H-binding protein [Cyclobacteriaceae bacterium]|nr:NAD(P)H-binding protein [Cyclobacteriaceae bacterium]
MANISIIGGSGNLGTKVAEYALEAGHSVMAFSRHEDSCDLYHKNLVKINGDVLQLPDVENCLQGSDVIISTLGASGGSGLEVLHEGIKNIVKAAKSQNISRVIAVGGSGILQVDEGRLMKSAWYFPVYLRELADAQYHVFSLLKNSGLTWTVICPHIMHHGIRSGDYRHRDTFSLPETKDITFEDVADFIIKEIDKKAYLNVRVAISY